MGITCQMTEWEQFSNTTEQTYDGDGQPLKRIGTRTSTPSFSSSTSFYLRSAVLGGAVIADLNTDGEPAGAAHYRYIYASGGVLAREEYVQLACFMRWQHGAPDGVVRSMVSFKDTNPTSISEIL
jgi:hypothetical protein